MIAFTVGLGVYVVGIVAALIYNEACEDESFWAKKIFHKPCEVVAIWLWPIGIPYLYIKGYKQCKQAQRIEYIERENRRLDHELAKLGYYDTL